MTFLNLDAVVNILRTPTVSVHRIIRINYTINNYDSKPTKDDDVLTGALVGGFTCHQAHMVNYHISTESRVDGFPGQRIHVSTSSCVNEFT